MSDNTSLNSVGRARNGEWPPSISITSAPRSTAFRRTQPTSRRTIVFHEDISRRHLRPNGQGTPLGEHRERLVPQRAESLSRKGFRTIVIEPFPYRLPGQAERSRTVACGAGNETARGFAANSSANGSPGTGTNAATKTILRTGRNAATTGTHRPEMECPTTMMSCGSPSFATRSMAATATRAHSIAPARVIVHRQVRRHDLVAARDQLVSNEIPGRTVVQAAVQ